MTNHVPPLRQSVFETMACEHSYNLVYIQGLKTPDTAESTRGTEIHGVLAKYLEHCAKKRCPADFMYLDALIDGFEGDPTGQEAADILKTCRDNLDVDWQNFLAAEASMGLDEEFRPTYSYDHDGRAMNYDNSLWPSQDHGYKEPAYCGIADGIYLMPGGKVARIEDFKSHPRSFPADTFQGKLYSLFLFMHLPELREVTFKLRFVRYANVNTEHTFYRSDVPNIMEDVRRVRARQISIHQRDEDCRNEAKVNAKDIRVLSIHGGSHCAYCPAIIDLSCPILKLNPFTALEPAERLNFRLVSDVANRANNKAMAQYVDGTGKSIQSQDSNGKLFTFGPVPVKTTIYPLFAEDGQGGFQMPIVDALLDWQNANPEDLKPKRATDKPWLLNLRIGSTKLKSYLKAKKRELIDNRIKDLAKVEESTPLKITRDASVDDGAGEEWKQYGEGTDIEF